MIIPLELLCKVCFSPDIAITGVFHVGAHECEELSAYNQLGVSSNTVIWVDAIPQKVLEAKNRGIENVYHAVVTDKDDEDVVFNVSNNFQSSSVLELGTHAYEYPHVVYVDTLHQKSITIDSFFHRNNIDPSKYNFWNFDIQGAELLALKGATKSLPYVKAIYLEVNERELYKNCGLIGDIDVFLSQYNLKRIITHMTPSGWGDALYVSDELTQHINSIVDTPGF
jgi:FkbM family methyltransferase